MAAHAFPLFRTFARDTRGAAGIELGFGAVALLTIAMLCFDLYSLVRVNTAGARSAVAMAEYVSREAAPDGDQMAALGRFLHRQEFGAPADVVYVVSAVRRPPGEDPAEVLWADDTIRFGAAGTTETLAGECARRGTAGWRTALLGDPETSGMDGGRRCDKSARSPGGRAEGGPAHRGGGRMNVLVLACAAGGSVSLLGIAAFLLLRRGDKEFRRRLQRAATPLADRAATDDTTAETDIFRSADTRSRSARLWRAVESRYPLLNARRTLPRAIAIGAVAATGLWFSMWFLKIPSGWWTIPLVGLGGVAAAWYAMSWFQTRQATEFTHQFPEVIDQIVRLSGAGVPPLEAIAVVAEDTRPPVQPVLRSVCDGLIAGLDADTALISVARRVRIAEFTLFTAVLRLQRRSGGGISSTFANLSLALRQRRSTG